MYKHLEKEPTTFSLTSATVIINIFVEGRKNI
jgi:hypothetical protein